MKKYKFTLIEILTVIGIMGVLAAITIPAFGRLFQGQKSTLAARDLMARIQLAKTHAEANQVCVAIVFPGNEEYASRKTLPFGYPFSSYRICEVLKDQSQNKYVFQRWVSEWYFLPKGICIGLSQGENYAALPDKNWSDCTALMRLVKSPKDDYISEDRDFLMKAVPSGADSFEPDEKIATTPIYNCTVFDVTQVDNSLVTFCNAFVLNSYGRLPDLDKEFIIPLREAVMHDSAVPYVTGTGESPADYIPIRVSNTGNVRFFDGFVSQWEYPD